MKIPHVRCCAGRIVRRVRLHAEGRWVRYAVCDDHVEQLSRMVLTRRHRPFLTLIKSPGSDAERPAAVCG